MPFFKRISSEEKVYRSDQIKILDHEGQEDIKTFHWKNLKSSMPKAQLTLSEKNRRWNFNPKKFPVIVMTSVLSMNWKKNLHLMVKRLLKNLV